MCIFSVTSESINAKWPNVENEIKEQFLGGIVNDCFTCKNIRYVTRLLTFEKKIDFRNFQDIIQELIAPTPDPEVFWVPPGWLGQHIK